MKSFRAFLNVTGWCAFGFVLVLGGVLVGAYALYGSYQARAARFDLTAIGEVSQRSAVYDANGELYSYLHGQNRLVIPLHRVSPAFLAAVVAREDARFWEHDGVDLKGIGRAAWTNFRERAVRQGASTLTQQLTRSAFQLTGRTLDRKALEAVLARRIEATYSKKEILELYVNRVYFGSGFYGIEAAARGYFGKPASELTLSESALLAGVIRSPNKLSPARDLGAALVQRDAVLDRMVELQTIQPTEAQSARESRPVLAQQAAMRFEDDYAMDAVKREVERLLPRDVIDFGGLRIFTTIDPNLQRIAEDAADRRLTEIEKGKNFAHPKKADFIPGDEPGKQPATNYLQAAVVAIDNRTGAIRAIVGGRDYAQSKYPRALLSKRQIGSTFKPFVYGAAFERGLLPGTLVDDSKIVPGEFRDIARNWSPANSEDDYAGLQPAAWGLLKSRNTMSVRVGEYAGLPTVRYLGRCLDIADAIPDVPSVFLGAFETTLKDLTAAYTIFPNLGVKRVPHLVARIETADGKILCNADQTDKRVLSPESAWMVSWILQHVVKTGTAAKAASLGWNKPGAGKTGTTNDFFDAWFVGYTTSLTCGVWVGMDEPQPIMEKGYGSALALPIWVDFMRQVPEKIYPANSFQPPVPLVAVRLCSASGGRATTQCERLRLGYETRLPANRLPNAWCPNHPELQVAPLYLTSAGVSPSIPPAPRYDSALTSERSMPPGMANATTWRVDDAVEIHHESGAAFAEPTAPPVVLRSMRTAEVPRIQPAVEQPPQRVRILRAIPVERSQRANRPFDPGGNWGGETNPSRTRRVIHAIPAGEPEG